MSVIFALNSIIALQLIVETLPLSSSAHVWLGQFVLEKFRYPQPDFITEEFMDVLFLPTALVLFLYFYHPIKLHLSCLVTSVRHITRDSSHAFFKKIVKILGLITVGIVSTCNTYFVLKYLGAKINIYPAHLWIVIFLGLLITSLLHLSTGIIQQSPSESLSFSSAALIGAVQGIAVLPGISRLGSTLVAGYWLGIPARRSFEYSTLLQVAIFCANLVKNSLTSSYHYHEMFKHLTASTYVTLIIASIISYGGVYLTDYLNKNRMLWLLSSYFFIPLTIILFITFYHQPSVFW